MEKKKIENRKECISYEDFLSQLADQLSFNYVSVSFGETHKDGLIHGIDKPRDIYENIFSDP
ncbi:MAG: hypothetical protein IPJ82_22545 [Lewinellaceae bacterium]|nr:hypothetical protein [Lewinellaceae bacterium]